MKERLLIAGVDPGTTIGFALLDINGEIILVDSSKNLDLSELINIVIRYGRVVIVGSDVNPAGHFVEAFSRKFGARLIVPEISLTIKKKKQLTNNYYVKDIHERDALATAIFAYKKIRKLFDRIDLNLSRNKKEEASNYVKKLMLVEDVNNIHDAVVLADYSSR